MTKKNKKRFPQDLPAPDSLQAIHRLRLEIKSAPIELNGNMRKLLPQSVSSGPFRISVDEFGDIIKQNGLLPHDRWGRIDRELEILEDSTHCKNVDCSGEWTYSSRSSFF